MILVSALQIQDYGYFGNLYFIMYFLKSYLQETIDFLDSLGN